MLQPNLNPNSWLQTAWRACRPILRRFPLWVVLLCLGLGLALSSPTLSRQTAIAQSPQSPAPDGSTPVGTVDPIPPEHQLGRSLYLESCATCHIGVPPALLPVQSWQFILEEPGHYGVQITPPTNPGRLLVWQYLQQFSRSLRDEEPPPFRLENSRYFKALHPRVEFTEPVRLQGCVTCHPQVNLLNFRALTPNWADAP